jgi:hypothetical protein
MGQLRKHIADVGVDTALESLGQEKQGEGESVQYGGHNLEGNANPEFVRSYLARNGISLIHGTQPTGSKRAISTTASSSDTEGLHARGEEGDVFPQLQTLRDKLHEAQHLPGLEPSEDLGKLMGKEFGNRVEQFTPEVEKKLDETYGEGKWIVKSYGDEAYAGYGIFFPQRAKQLQQDAQNAIYAAGQEIGRYDFKFSRDPDTGKIIGIQHGTGDNYQFGTPEYESTINGDVRAAADRIMKPAQGPDGQELENSSIADSEQGAAIPTGSFMAQPAFPVVGISNEERAQGVTFKKGQEGRVHIVTRNGKAMLVSHSTWLKNEHLPVVFESAETRAMAQAAVDAINALPESERKGQLYAPDVVRTADGYKVVEANPANEAGASGYLQDNPMIIDAYVSQLTGRDPAHVKFIRKLLSGTKTKRLQRTIMKTLQRPVNRLKTPTKKDWTDDEMLSAGFPKFVRDPEDRERLEQFASVELQAWRQAVATHRSLTSINAKLRNRPQLETAFAALKRKYDEMKRGTGRKSVVKTSNPLSPIPLPKGYAKLGPVNRLREKSGHEE